MNFYLQCIRYRFSSRAVPPQPPLTQPTQSTQQSCKQAATSVVLSFGLGSGGGVAAGGAAGQLLYNARKEWMAALMGGSALLGTLPLYWLVNADLGAAGLGATCVMASLAGR